MIIIALVEDHLFVCSQSKPMFKVKLDDPNLLAAIPTGDILFVQSGTLIRKNQLAEWLKQEFSLSIETSQAVAKDDDYDNDERFVHPTNNGYITIDDIRTPSYPNGLIFTSKWDFVSLRELGEDIEDRSPIFRNMLRKKRIEYVSAEYARKNRDRGKSTSSVDAALDKILVPVGMKAEDVAADGGLGDHTDIAIPISIV